MKSFMAAITLLLIILSILVGIQAIVLAEANPITYRSPRVAIVSPQNGVTFNSSQVTLSVEIQLFGYTYSSLEVISWARFAVDNGVTAPLNLDMPSVIGPGTMINSTDIIPNLTEGNHTINIFLETSFGESANANATFTTNTQPTPTLSTTPTRIPTPSVSMNFPKPTPSLTSSPTPSPSPPHGPTLTPSPSVPEFQFGFVLLMALAIMAVAVAHRRLKSK
jgi:hypothetical protein